MDRTSWQSVDMRNNQIWPLAVWVKLRRRALLLAEDEIVEYPM